MTTVTALKLLPSDPDRVSVRVDRRKVATLSRESVRELGLEIGTPWTEDLAEQVAALASREKAYQHALRIVRRRAVGTEELRRKLERKEHEAADVAAAVERLEAAGYLDDRAYAETIVRREMARRPAGPRLLRAKLQQKHLPRELVNAVVDEVDDPDEHLTAALQLAEKKLATGAMQRADAATRHRRLVGLLARRGFDTGTIYRTLDQLPMNDDV